MHGVTGRSSFGKRSEGIGRAVASGGVVAHANAPAAEPDLSAPSDPSPTRPAAPKTAKMQAETLKDRVMSSLLDRIDTSAVARLTRAEVADALRPVVSDVLVDLKLTLNTPEQAALERMILHDLAGLGPLEDLIADDGISDILINGPDQVYIERNGRLELADVRFRDSDHLLQIAQRICNGVGRRVDQSSPLADARLADGSRVNIVAQPLSLRGPTLSIRKFAAKAVTLETIMTGGGCSRAMARVLRVAAACRANIVICGGTGSGKTTLLNALSQQISSGERIITIEDAAELRLQQPHVVTLETRPVNVDGQGAITIRDLVRNALRMRPDRIILGEIRGAEAFDLLAAMNTGHDGSMCTLHANSPREALMRLENMVMMSDLKVPRDSVIRQIAESVDVVVQVKRLRDGSRRITSITEVTGCDNKVLLTHELFAFEYIDESPDGRIRGEYKWTGIQPHFAEKARQFALTDELKEALQ